MLSVQIKNNNLWTLLDSVGTRKLPCSTWRRGWGWKHDIYLRKTKNFFPFFSVLGHGISHPRACKSHKCPVLINLFLSTTLLLLNSPLHWDIKDSGTRILQRPRWNDPNRFQYLLYNFCLLAMSLTGKLMTVNKFKLVSLAFRPWKPLTFLISYNLVNSTFKLCLTCGTCQSLDF